MAPATRTRRRLSSNTAEAPPPSPYTTSTTRTKKRDTGGGDVEGEGGDGKRRLPPPAADDGGEKEREKKTAFVTVGTTRFDALVRAVDCPLFETALLSRGFARLVVQAGAGGHRPERLLGLAKEEEEEEEEKKKKKKSKGSKAATKNTMRFSGTTARGLSVEFFDYAPSLGDRFAAADLVVTHAGAGSIFETLSMARGPSSSNSSPSSSSPPPIPLIAVPNGALMHNHQAELASELEARGLLVSATPETLAGVLAGADLSRLRRYDAGGGALGVVAAIDELSGRRRRRRRSESSSGKEGGSKRARKG